ncbi:ABC transporter permease [Anaerotruncus rubiinfantis]|uniref:ABC transporter permease n=1 Tax=Anaerotruncus rubiinfantis TaxID=1720200 RepID=UPI001A9AFB95|nr:ABC transporter permease [Anaerotruncus rubiinfantis]
MNISLDGAVNGSLKALGKRKLIYVVIALFIISALIDRSYLNSFNLNSLLTDITIIGLLALGEMLAILSGGIDLSVGNTASAASVFVAFMMIQLEGLPPWMNLILSVLFALVFCMALGAFNGFSIAVLGIPPMIATLGGMWISKGLAYYFLDGMATPFKVSGFSALARTKIGFLPISFLILLAIAGLVYYVLTHKRIGRAVYAIGGDRYSAQLSGINITRTTILIYTASALLAALGGLVLGSYTGTGYVKGANGYELWAIAAVAIGGVSMSGGTGDTWNAMLGVFVFRMIKKLMVYANLSDRLEGLYIGILLLIALAISTSQGGGLKQLKFLTGMHKHRSPSGNSV